MWHQFKELADVDITQQPMEVGPTCHYVMGGVLVDPDSGAAEGVPGLFAAGEVAGGMHGSNRLGGNSLSDLIVFGRRAGIGAVNYLQNLTSRPNVTDEAIAKSQAHATAPLNRAGGENPYTIQADLQQTTNDLVGIIRIKHELEESIGKLSAFHTRLGNVKAEGGTAYNPGWHLALDLENMLLVSECIARAALIREESRGGHTREDFPKMSSEWRKVNLECSFDGNSVSVNKRALPEMREDLLNLFEVDELKKYMTEPELQRHAKGAQA
jgi:succinate dehydrogenase / fumarate reductase flavoprotein subunit